MDLKSYTGQIRFSDACISIIADTGDFPRGYSEQRNEWELHFKRDVFKRIIQQLNRLGWTCKVPEEYIKSYGVSFARNYRECQKGDLFGKLELHSSSIQFQIWQNVNVPRDKREDGKGEYLYDKEEHMPYLLLLEMKRTRNRLRKYLESVCSFKFDDTWHRSRMHVGPGKFTAFEWIHEDYRNCWHYKPELGRRDGDEQEWNSKSAEGKRLQHGMPVWFYDWKGRLNKGTAYYNINNMWWVVTGKYGYRNLGSHDLYIDLPGDPRIKKNAKLRADILRRELGHAVSTQNFERAIILRDVAKQGKAQKVGA